MSTTCPLNDCRDIFLPSGSGRLTSGKGIARGKRSSCAAAKGSGSAPWTRSTLPLSHKQTTTAHPSTHLLCLMLYLSLCVPGVELHNVCQAYPGIGVLSTARASVRGWPTPPPQWHLPAKSLMGSGALVAL